MTTTRRKLFGLIPAALAAVAVKPAVASDWEAVRADIEECFRIAGSMFRNYPGSPRFYVGLNKRAVHRWVAADGSVVIDFGGESTK